MGKVYLVTYWMYIFTHVAIKPKTCKLSPMFFAKFQNTVPISTDISFLLKTAYFESAVRRCNIFPEVPVLFGRSTLLEYLYDVVHGCYLKQKIKICETTSFIRNTVFEGTLNILTFRLGSLSRWWVLFWTESGWRNHNKLVIPYYSTQWAHTDKLKVWELGEIRSHCVHSWTRSGLDGFS